MSDSKKMTPAKPHYDKSQLEHFRMDPQEARPKIPAPESCKSHDEGEYQDK